MVGCPERKIDPKKVLILGHSFVRRFQFFLHEGLDSGTFPGLDLSSVEIHFLEIGGRTVAKILDHVRALQPDIVVLEIGSNDLCEAGHCPKPWVPLSRV